MMVSVAGKILVVINDPVVFFSAKILSPEQPILNLQARSDTELCMRYTKMCGKETGTKPGSIIIIFINGGI